jgi:ketosteroid isomerase-like protein
MSDENVEVFWRSCAAFDRGDYERALEAIYPEIEYDLTHFPEGRVYHGHGGIREAFRGWLGAFDEYRQDREVIATADDKLVVAVSEQGRGKASRAEVVRHTYAIWNMRAGKAVRITFFGTRQAALEAADLRE